MHTYWIIEFRYLMIYLFSLNIKLGTKIGDRYVKFLYVLSEILIWIVKYLRRSPIQGGPKVT
jgi:hypothetical protein